MSIPMRFLRWYGRKAHADFDVCADDHCQRYQGITKAFSPAAAEAVRATTGEFLRTTADLRRPVFQVLRRDHRTLCDGLGRRTCPVSRVGLRWCDATSFPNSGDMDSLQPTRLLQYGRFGAAFTRLPGFDQETRDFYRWQVAYTGEELAELIRSRIAVDSRPIRSMQALARGVSGRIYRPKSPGNATNSHRQGAGDSPRASPTHLYSSAFVVDNEPGRFVLRGAGWGHGVGLCQIGAAVMANGGAKYTDILLHYYRGTSVSV